MAAKLGAAVLGFIPADILGIEHILHLGRSFARLGSLGGCCARRRCGPSRRLRRLRLHGRRSCVKAYAAAPKSYADKQQSYHSKRNCRPFCRTLFVNVSHLLRQSRLCLGFFGCFLSFRRWCCLGLFIFHRGFFRLRFRLLLRLGFRFRLRLLLRLRLRLRFLAKLGSF